MVQWLRLHPSNEVGVGLVPGWGTNIPHAVGCGWGGGGGKIDLEYQEKR